MTVEELQKELIENIVRMRKEKGYTQQRLSKESGVSQPVIARIERGVTNPQLETLIKMLLPLGKTLSIVPIPNNLKA